MHGVAELLAQWGSFYTIMGSSAAALTGLLFVVISLVSSQRSTSEAGVSVFTTPSVVHFCCVLFVAAIMTVPFHSVAPLTVAFALAGGAGVVYAARIARSQRRLTSYQPDAEDWAWHVILPFVAYLVLLTGAATLPLHPAIALFAPAFASLLLIFIAIHNAWDVVTFLAMGKADDLPDSTDELG